jgi:hypothetical protein
MTVRPSPEPRNPDDVFAGLADGGLERLGLRLGECRRGDQKYGRGQGQKSTRVTY